MLAAAKSGDVKVLKEIIERGMRPDLKNYEGMTALHYAVQYGRLDCVKYLLEPCMDKYNLTRIETSKGRNNKGTPIKMACKDTNVSIGIIKALIQADPKAIDIGEDYGDVLYWACYSKRPSVVKLLVKAGTNLNGQNCRTRASALHIASRINGLNCLNILLNSGADASLQNCDGRTALFLAVSDGYMPNADALLNYMSPKAINLLDINGHTVLMLAAQRGQERFMSDLLSRGADPYIKNYKGNYAVDLTNNYDCVKFLLRSMFHSHLQFLKDRAFPYRYTTKRNIVLICETIPELFALQAIEYLYYNCEKDRFHCIHIIDLLLSKLPMKNRPNRMVLNHNSTMTEMIDTYLTAYEQDIILCWWEPVALEKPHALPVQFGWSVPCSTDLFSFLASMNPHYSPSFIMNRAAKIGICLETKLRLLNIPKSWELEYSSEEDIVQSVKSLKHLSRCSLRKMFCVLGLLSYKEFCNGLEDLGLPKSLQLYVRYVDPRKISNA